MFIQETVNWLENKTPGEINYDTLKSWMVIEPKKESIDKETHFCDAVILENILRAKVY